MNIDKFKKNLKKIINFEDLVDIENEKLSRIEKDILLDYIKNLYKAVLEENLDFQDEEAEKRKKVIKKAK